MQNLLTETSNLRLYGEILKITYKLLCLHNNLYMQSITPSIVNLHLYLQDAPAFVQKSFPFENKL